jgi:predicted O-methyltransferase YrrM
MSNEFDPTLSLIVSRGPREIYRVQGVQGYSATRMTEALALYPGMLEALTLAAETIATARQYFPKSMRNHDRFKLEQTAAAIGTILANVTP